MSMTKRWYPDKRITNLNVLKIICQRLGWGAPSKLSYAENEYGVNARTRDDSAVRLRFDLNNGSVAADGDYSRAVNASLALITEKEYTAATFINSLQEKGLEYTESKTEDGCPRFEVAYPEPAYA